MDLLSGELRSFLGGLLLIGLGALYCAMFRHIKPRGFKGNERIYIQSAMWPLYLLAGVWMIVASFTF